MTQKNQRLRLDDASAIAKSAFREKYPPGVINIEVLREGIWCTLVNGPEYRVSLVYHFKGMGSFNPFTFFEAVVDKVTGAVEVTVAEDPATIPLERLQDSDEPDSEWGGA